MSEAETATEARRYDLVVRTDRARFVFRFPYAGVILHGDRLEWTTDRHYERPYSAILSIHLTTAFIARSGSIGTCVVSFRDGTELTIASTTSSGLSDDGRNGIYADFVSDLHGRLAEADRKRISFVGGNTANFQTFGKITLVVAALFFVALPVVLFLITREWKALGLALPGFFLVYPLWNVVNKNEPRTYDPRAIDGSLLP